MDQWAERLPFLDEISVLNLFLISGLSRPSLFPHPPASLSHLKGCWDNAGLTHMIQNNLSVSRFLTSSRNIEKLPFPT